MSSIEMFVAGWFFGACAGFILGGAWAQRDRDRGPPRGQVPPKPMPPAPRTPR